MAKRSIAYTPNFTFASNSGRERSGWRRDVDVWKGWIRSKWKEGKEQGRDQGCGRDCLDAGEGQGKGQERDRVRERRR